MWYALTHHWNFARFMRVALGVMILVQGLLNHDNGVIAMGGFFSLFGLFTTGCCGVDGCATPNREMKGKPIEDVTFEEIKTIENENK
ncbi:MAG: hypothetical protein ACKOXR_05895 [Bacteroidota bacterium]